MLERSTDTPATDETPAGEPPDQAASGPARHFGPLFFAQLAAVGLVVALLPCSSDESRQATQEPAS